jgi:hypothetical protein
VEWDQEAFLRRVWARAQARGLRSLAALEAAAGLSPGVLKKSRGYNITTIYRIADALHWSVPEALGWPPVDRARLGRAARIAAIALDLAPAQIAAIGELTVRAYDMLDAAAREDPATGAAAWLERALAAALRGTASPPPGPRSSE